MKLISMSTIALGVLMGASSILPANAMQKIGQPIQPSSQIEQAQVTIKYKNWRGHRGYRNARPGYRRHSDGFWYPRAAFTLKVAPGVRIKVGPRHARWCRDRYRSYRASDNTYVVRRGVRRACRSPFR